MGRVINDYDKFVGTIGLDEKVYDTAGQSILDKNGEVDSFFNIQIRGTNTPNMYLVSAENFDVRDNDFILYRLLFTPNIKKYIDRISKVQSTTDKVANDQEIEF